MRVKFLFCPDEREKKARERKKKKRKEEKKRKIRPFFAFHQKIFELFHSGKKVKKRRREPHTINTLKEEEFVKEEEEFIHQRLQRR